MSKKLWKSRHQLFEFVVDEDALDVQPNVVRILVKHVFGKLKRQHAWNVEDCFSLYLTLQNEMGVSHGLVVGVTEGALVKVLVLLLFHLTG